MNSPDKTRHLTKDGTVTDADVVIVGAGPVGLLLALELTLGGASVVVVERLTEPSTVAKALMVGAPGTEALLRRGFAPAIAEAEQRTLALLQRARELGGPDAPRGAGGKFSGHFAGLAFLRTDAQEEPHRRGRPIDQASVEAMLSARVSALGIPVHRGCEVADLAMRDDSVRVTCLSAGREHVIRGRWLVGCDGGRSAVRKLAGIGFPGTPPTLTMLQATLVLDHPERLQPGWQRTTRGVYSYGFLPNRLIMLDFSGPPADRTAPVTRDEVESALRWISDADVRVETLEAGTRWTDNTRLADTYRQGRVFLAGDAAHVHSPFGGQGMSLGLVDAANLGWKLAAVIRGKAPESLLDTYTTERRPIAEAVLDNTRAQAAIMRPDPQSGAMRQLVARLLEFDDVNAFLGGMMSGLAARYDLGSTHPGVGRLTGDLPVRANGQDTTLYALMQEGAGVFMDASAGEEASAHVARLALQVRCARAVAGPSMLVRPDACVAWLGAGDADDLVGRDELDDALRRWFAAI